MLIDLVHNKIIEDTISEKFAESAEEGLVSLLAGRYGDRMLGIQLYEDHLADGFMRDGEWYYPVTVITEGGAELAWVKWTVDASFDDGVPYSYMGEKLIEFSFADAVPVEFLDKMKGRAFYYEGGYINIKVQSTSQKPTFLAGKYSQSFVDEMARQITLAISETMLVHGIEESNIELHLVFAPATYMEHISENVTYRRLLIVGKSGAPKDLWIKWTRLDGKGAATVSDHVNAEMIDFELGEDVPQKIREKEYRFLLARSGDKYRNAMGRKTVTEWREIIKRAIKRGELLKLDPPLADEPTEEIAAVACDETAVESAEPEALAESSPKAETESEEEDEFARAMRIAREAVGATADSESDEDDETDPEVDEITKLAMAALASVRERPAEISFGDEDDDVTEETEEAEETEEVSDETAASTDDSDGYGDGADYNEMDEDEYEDGEAVREARSLEPDGEPDDGEPQTAEPERTEAPAPVKNVIYNTVSAEQLEEKIRGELEAKIRLEYESQARARAEEEAARLRREQEQLRAENERLQELARREREAKAEREEARRAEEARLRAQIEAQVRAEAKEKERLAEAARNAIAEQQRLQEERAERERKRIEEEARLEAERRRAEEAARLEAERRREAERIRLEREDKEARDKANVTAPRNDNYTYTSKSVKLIFRRNVDPNITGRIHETIKATIDYYKKSDVYIRIKASVPEPSVVVLDFIKIPEEEMELLKNIIKVLGNSGMGIAKAIVE